MSKNKGLISITCLLMFCLSSVSCGNQIYDNSNSQLDKDKTNSNESIIDKQGNSEVDSDSKENSDQEKKKLTGTTKAHLVCVGDNLIHDNIYVEALEKGGGKEYDFSDCYKHIEKYIKGADVAILNQETIVSDEFEVSSYPTFCSPTAVGDKVVDIGFNVISMSNNHVLDKGEDGLISSLDYWDTKDVVHYGAYRSSEDAEDIKTMTVNDITFAFLGYMEHTNGVFLNDNAKAEVIYLSEQERIKKQIEKANEIADVVVVSCHFGTEISNEINDQQQTLAPKLVEWGADLIIGTQAHALSTCEYIEKPDGSKAFVYYGLGNFFSTMYEAKSMIGLIGELDVIKNHDTGVITLENVKAIPVVSHFEADSFNSYWYNCTVYPYAEYTDELFTKHFDNSFNRSAAEKCLSYIPKDFLSIE